MKLARLVPVAAVSLVVLISVMLFNFGIAQWRSYQSARARPEAIRLIHEAMSVVEKTSFERGPANGVLGDDDPLDAAKQERLRQARAASDAAIETLYASLARDNALRNGDVEQALYKTRVLLAQARRKVDEVSALPRRERTQERLMDEALHPMFDAVQVAMETVSLLIHRANTVYGELPDGVMTAQLVNMMREYAGRLGSQFTPALTGQKPIARTENEAIRLLRGRVEQLRMLVELPLELPSANRRVVAAVERMEQRYFGASLDVAARLERMSDQQRLPYPLDTAQFAALYVPGMASIVDLRDVLISIAMQEAEKDVLDARYQLIRTVLIGCIFSLLVVLLFAILHRRVVHPLRAIKHSLIRLADGTLNDKMSLAQRKDEIGDIIDAIGVLRNHSIERERLDLERQRLIDELEASEMHQITLNTGLEQRVRKQTAFLERFHQELEASLSSVVRDFQAQLDTLGATVAQVDPLTRRDGTERLARLDDFLVVLRSRVQRLAACQSMLHELRWLRQVDIELCEVDMTMVVAQLADELGKCYPRATIEINALFPLRSDRILVTKILANLLDNALKYSSKSDSPFVEIGCWRVPDATTYWIRDNGSGFDPLGASCIFEPFKRLHADGDYEGKGIGLTIAYWLVELLGGRIWAESHPGQGATFFFTLGESAAQARAASNPAVDFDSRPEAPVTG